MYCNYSSKESLRKTRRYTYPYRITPPYCWDARFLASGAVAHGTLQYADTAAEG